MQGAGECSAAFSTGRGRTELKLAAPSPRSILSCCMDCEKSCPSCHQHTDILNLCCRHPLQNHYVWKTESTSKMLPRHGVWEELMREWQHYLRSPKHMKTETWFFLLQRRPGIIPGGPAGCVTAQRCTWWPGMGDHLHSGGEQTPQQGNTNTQTVHRIQFCIRTDCATLPM